jgi:glycosyltransferase involved in cell wall biosynthesis
MEHPRYSVIVPVYNRPEEVDELLKSLTFQTRRDFDVIIVEDGSSIRCEDIVNDYRGKLDIHYFYKPNTGPGPSRNFGYAQAAGDYLVVFDSDCIIPPHYFEAVDSALNEHHWQAWGGPDKAHGDFTPVQRAMGYTMASFFTTGGIRGGRKHIGSFQPRSFNMGISREVYQETQGFAFDRFAEDIEFSIRMKRLGFRVGLIPEAYVYHKRRTTFAQFYKQVSNFGKGRVLVGKKYPGEIKLTHWFPTVFMLGTCLIALLPIISLPLFMLAITLLALYLILIFSDSLLKNKNLWVAVLSVPSAIIQLFGYGIGFLKERIRTD